MLTTLLALALSVETPAVSSSEARALVEAVQASIDDVRRRQAALPPPTSDAERLVRLGELDQAARKVVTAFDFSRIPESERETALALAVAPMTAADQENQRALLALVPAEGWFTRSRYGAPAARAAFNIVQHADTAMQRRFLPKLEALAKVGEVDGQNVAMMFDRIAIAEGRPQRYGTQFRCDGGKWRPYPLEDEANVEALRRNAGVGWSYAENKAQVQAAPPCPQTRSPPPPGMKLD